MKHFSSQFLINLIIRRKNNKCLDALLTAPAAPEPLSQTIIFVGLFFKSTTCIQPQNLCTQQAQLSVFSAFSLELRPIWSKSTTKQQQTLKRVPCAAAGCFLPRLRPSRIQSTWRTEMNLTAKTSLGTARKFSWIATIPSISIRAQGTDWNRFLLQLPICRCLWFYKCC